MKRPLILIIAVLTATGLLNAKPAPYLAMAAAGFSPIAISRMDNLSTNPAGYSFIDWKDKTETYIDFLFNRANTVTTIVNSTPRVQPVSWLATAPNVDAYFGESGNRIVAFPSYFGMKNDPNIDTSRGEGIAVLAAVLSASLVGYDMTAYAPEGSIQAPLDYVRQMVNYYAIHNGEKVVLNNSSSNTGGSWWYELLPSSLFTALASMYLERQDYDGAYLEDILLNMARQWYAVVVAAGGANANFSDRKSYSIRNGTFTSGGWSEPDAAAGMAFVLYMAYSHFKAVPAYENDVVNFLNGAKWCMNFLSNLSYNPFYEVLIYFAPLVAARMNLEQGTNYNVTKMINWTLDGSSAVRGGWGMVNANWGGYNTQGLMGSLTDGDGYSFMMNTFDAALGFFPLVKYHPGYARSIGKWILNVSDSAKYYYPDYLPENNQTCYDWAELNGTGSFIAYEGLRKINKNNAANSPAGWGDPLDYDWGPLTDFGYGNNHVGFFASIEATNVNRVLRTDLNAHDFFQDHDYETYLYYNPYDTYQNIEITLDDAYLFNVTSGQRQSLDAIGFGKYSFALPSGEAAVMAVIPNEATITFEGGCMFADGRFAARVQPGLVTSRPLPLSDDNRLEIATSYPEFVKPDQIDIYSGTDLIGQAEVDGNAASVSVTINRSGNGYLPITIVPLRNDVPIETRNTRVIVIDDATVPVLDPPGDSDLATMFQSAYSAWNGGTNPDKGSSDNYRAAATLLESGVRLRLTSDTWGVAGTSPVSLDFDKLALLQFRVMAVSHRWAVKIFVAGGDRWGYYLSGETSDTGVVTIDVEESAQARNSSFAFSGVKTCYVWFIPVGGANAEMTISDLNVYSMANDLEYEFPNPQDSSSSSLDESSSESSTSESSSSENESSFTPSTSSTGNSLPASNSDPDSSPDSNSTIKKDVWTRNLPVVLVNLASFGAFFILKKKKML